MLSTRNGKPEDRAFVVSTMIKSLRSGCHLYRKIDKDAYQENYNKIVDKLLDTAKLTVVCLTEDADVIIGYAIRRDSVLDYVYVKHLWRGKGIARSLCSEIKTCSHLTSLVEPVIIKHGIKFNPFA